MKTKTRFEGEPVLYLRSSIYDVIDGRRDVEITLTLQYKHVREVEVKDIKLCSTLWMTNLLNQFFYF